MESPDEFSLLTPTTQPVDIVAPAMWKLPQRRQNQTKSLWATWKTTLFSHCCHSNSLSVAASSELATDDDNDVSLQMTLRKLDEYFCETSGALRVQYEDEPICFVPLVINPSSNGYELDLVRYSICAEKGILEGPPASRCEIFQFGLRDQLTMDGQLETIPYVAFARPRKPRSILDTILVCKPRFDDVTINVDGDDDDDDDDDDVRNRNCVKNCFHAVVNIYERLDCIHCFICAYWNICLRGCNVSNEMDDRDPILIALAVIFWRALLAVVKTMVNLMLAFHFLLLWILGSVYSFMPRCERTCGTQRCQQMFSKETSFRIVLYVSVFASYVSAIVAFKRKGNNISCIGNFLSPVSILAVAFLDVLEGLLSPSYDTRNFFGVRRVFTRYLLPTSLLWYIIARVAYTYKEDIPDSYFKECESVTDFEKRLLLHSGEMTVVGIILGSCAYLIRIFSEGYESRSKIGLFAGRYSETEMQQNSV